MNYELFPKAMINRYD